VDFSIITPSLNYGRFLGECLASVADQEGVTLEHLVYDAGSTDMSREVASDFPNIVWIEETDSGMSEAINKGFERAQGDWVMWLNADDRLLPGVLGLLLQQLKQSEADVMYGDWNFINSSGEFTRRVKSLKWSALINCHHHCFVASTAAFLRRASIIDQGYRLRNDFRYVMDGEFYARLHAAGKSFVYLPVAVADFRLHSANASQINLAGQSSMDEVLRAERQHVESRAIRRCYGITLFKDPYLNGLVDGLLWIYCKLWKAVKKTLRL
jgi:glycosyltransferase involved in cell wall biosynthesis